jgi:hypothetical protein
MSLNQEQQAQLERDLASLTEDEIKRRLAHGIWGAEKRRLVELHLEKLEMERGETASTPRTDGYSGGYFG